MSAAPSTTTAALDEAGWLSGVRRVRSPNCDDRPPDTPIALIVVHAISLPPRQYGGDAIERLFTNRLEPQAHPYFEHLRGLKVSAHFLVVRDGFITQFVPCVQRAWHAGVSSWRGRARCNDFSVGIELEGCDDDAFEPAQYRALAQIVAAVQKHHPGCDIAGHCDIAPGRKTDPGPHFDWDQLRRLLPA